MEMIITPQNVAEAVKAIRAAAPDFTPEIGIVFGSGMGDAASQIEAEAMISYGDVPYMVPSTVQGHKGQLILGTLAGKRVVCMQGRLHPYEGYSAQQIAFPVYVMKELGATAIILTNASGGIDPSYEVGDLMLISDHINFQMMNPVLGPVTGMGPRFFDMTHAYSPELRTLAKTVAEEVGVQVREGVYIGDLGPSLETPAEIRAFRALGADAVGMSTVQEVIAANHIGLKVLAISLISNPAAGVCDEPLSIDDVLIAARKAGDNMLKLIKGVLIYM